MKKTSHFDSKSSPTNTPNPALLESWSFPDLKFKKTHECISSFIQPDFQLQPERKKFKVVNKALLQLIQEHETPCFLMPAVFHYIHEINRHSLLKEPYSFSLFEFWLNHFSKLTPEDNHSVRGKIVGRLLPREEYQTFFPIGMNKYFSGAHFVAAHLSPDVDTTIASLFGWIDAFGARVSEGIHQWSLPHGFSDGYVINLLEEIFSPGFLSHAPRTNPACTVAAIDLVTKKNFHKVSIHSRGDSIEHGNDDQAYIVVDDDGSYKGEWRSSDAESVRIVVSAFSNCLRWFENGLQRACIHALREESPSVETIHKSIQTAFSPLLYNSEPVTELSVRSKKILHDYLRKILDLPSGIQASFGELIQAIDIRFSSNLEKEIAAFLTPIEKNIAKASQTDTTSLRLYALDLLEKMVLLIAQEINYVRESMEKLSHLLEIKERVLGIPNECVFLKSSVEEMRNKADRSSHITVLVPESNGSSFPVGVVWTNDLKKSTLATASLRDFSNLEETKMASYIDVISIIDHHKSAIKTSASSTLILGDAQSCNTLIAEISYALNTQWNKSESEIEKNYELSHILCKSPELYNSVLELIRQNALQSNTRFFVDKNREITEYLLYIIAILDDTDLLSKVSRRDVLCLEKLINRIATLVAEKPTEVISLRDIPQDHLFAKNAAKRLVMNEELHSIYKKIYQFREVSLEKTLEDAAEGHKTSFFSDTKEQNGACRIGQTKLFERNIPTYTSLRKKVLLRWLKESENARKSNPHLDFFLHMVSTVPGEKEVYSGNGSSWSHKDEIWIFSPSGDLAEQHLATFLSLFQNSATGQTLPIDITIEGEKSESLESFIKLHYPKAKTCKIIEEEGHAPVIVLSFPAGQINSRKAQISPFLPKLVP